LVVESECPCSDECGADVHSTDSLFIMSILLATSPLRTTVGFSSTGLTPSRLAPYTAPNTDARRLVRGLGSPDQIEPKQDGSFLYGYYWVALDSAGKIKGHGIAQFQFDEHGWLRSYAAFIKDDKDQSTETTLQAAMALSGQ
jgi:hypothetical protein